VWVTECFSTGGLAGGEDFTLYISGIKTPLSTESSSSFEIATTDSDGIYIDSITSDLYITMARGKSISEVTVRPNSDVVGATDFYRIYFTAPSPFLSTYKAYITFPDEIDPPEAAPQNRCYSNKKVLQNQQYCEFSGQSLWLTLKPIKTIDAGDEIYYRIDDIRNPQTGDASSTFLIEVKNTNGYMVAESTGTDITVQVTTPAEMSKFALTATEREQGAETTLFIAFKTIHSIPSGGIIHLEWNNHYFKIEDEDNFDCSATGVPQSSPTCEIVDRNNIKIQDLFTSRFSAN